MLAFLEGWTFWTYVGWAITAFVAAGIMDLIFQKKLKSGKIESPTITVVFGFASVVLLAAGILFLPYSWIFGPSGEPLKGIYSYRPYPTSGFSIKFREDGSASYAIIYQGSRLTGSEWTHERRDSTITLHAINPDKVKLKKMEMTILENGNLRYIDEEGKEEIFVKLSD